MDESSAEILRLKYKYRTLLLTGKIHLPYRSAARLIGPDCAYHLYATHQSETKKTDPNPGETILQTGEK